MNKQDITILKKKIKQIFDHDIIFVIKHLKANSYYRNVKKKSHDHYCNIITTNKCNFPS